MIWTKKSHLWVKKHWIINICSDLLACWTTSHQDRDSLVAPKDPPPSAGQVTLYLHVILQGNTKVTLASSQVPSCAGVCLSVGQLSPRQAGMQWAGICMQGPLLTASILLPCFTGLPGRRSVLTGVGGEGYCPNEHPTAWGIQRLWRGWVRRTKHGWRQPLLMEIPKVEWDESPETWLWRHGMECCMK